MNNNHIFSNFGRKMGQFFAGTLALCLLACMTSAVIALTIKFITWLF